MEFNKLVYKLVSVYNCYSDMKRIHFDYQSADGIMLFKDFGNEIVHKLYEYINEKYRLNTCVYKNKIYRIKLINFNGSVHIIDIKDCSSVIYVVDYLDIGIIQK